MLIYHRENVLILCIGGNRALEIEIQTLKWSSYFDEVRLLLWFEVVWLHFSTIPKLRDLMMLLMSSIV